MTLRHFRNFVFFPFFILVILITMLWVAMPFVAKHYLTAYFYEQDKTLFIEKLSIGFFPPKIDIKNLTVTDQIRKEMTLKRVILEVKIWPLLTRTLHISKADIDGFDITVTQKEKEWIVAGINTSKYLNAGTTEDENFFSDQADHENLPAVPYWKIKLPYFSFTNSHLRLFRQPELNVPAELDDFTLNALIIKGLFCQDLHCKGSIDLSALVNQATLSINSQFDYSPELINADVTIDNSHLPIESFQHFMPSPFNNGKGQLTINGRFQFLQKQVNDVPFYEFQNLNVSSKIENLDLSLNADDRVLTQSASFALAQSSVQFASADQLKITGDLNLQSTQSSFAQAGQIMQLNQLALMLPLDIKRSYRSLTANIANTTLNMSGLLVSFNKTSAENKALKITLADAKLTAEQLKIDVIDQQPLILTGTNLNFSSQSLDSQLDDKNRIAAWESADISRFSFTQQNQIFDITLAQLNITDLTLSELLADTISRQTLPPLGHIGSIKIEQVEANQDGAQINTITTDSVKVNLIVDANKRIENLVFSAEEQQSLFGFSLQGSNIPKEKDANKTIKNTPDAEQNPAFKAPYYIILNAYDTRGDSDIYVQDKSISPTLQSSLEIDTLSLRNLNTQKKSQATVFALKARNGKYATLNSDITIWPLADKLTMQSELMINELELPPYSSYIANVLGYQVDSGQLDLDLTLNANNGVLDGSTHVLLRKFDLSGRQDSSSVLKAGVIPLNMVVGILKDNTDNIDLDILLYGDIDNPKFGWQDFFTLPVQKALYNVSSSYLMQTFVPYANVISIVQFAGDQLLKIRVEPLFFEMKESQLNNSQDTFLQQLTTLMKDKEKSYLKACGIASYRDLGFEKPPISIDDMAKASAKMLAQKRSNHLKDYLVEQGISSSRILLCSPEIDLSRSSQPRVELNF